MCLKQLKQKWLRPSLNFIHSKKWCLISGVGCLVYPRECTAPGLGLSYGKPQSYGLDPGVT